MAQREKLLQLADLLEETSLEEFRDYLPSPDYVNRVIQLTNAGKIGEALSLVNKTEYVYRLLKDSLSDDVKLWYQEIVQQLQRGVSTARDWSTE